MGGLKIAIVEDEMIVANDLLDLLEKQGYKVLEPVVSYGEAIEMLETESPDLVLLDIQLAGKKDGIDVAEVIKTNYAIPFIFLTGNSDFATLERAKVWNPSAYLVKPFKPIDLFASLELAFQQFNLQEVQEAVEKPASDSFFLKYNQVFHKIKFDDITFVKSDHNYLEVHTVTNNRFLYRGSILDLQKLLPKELLIQVHRGFLVNLNQVSKVDVMTIFIGDEKVPLGRKYKQEVFERLGV